MAQKTFIQSIFVDPPIAVARLGSSPAPQDAYDWQQSENPRTEGETVVAPAWSLNVLPDGRVEPIMPEEIRFRDGEQIRPVCPFFEVWAMVSERPADPPAAWEEAPLTIDLLQANGVTERALGLRIDARNRKAARRADNGRLAFGTFPAVSIPGDRHTPVPLRGVSPSPPAVPASRRMIPPGRSIPLGSVQVLRPAAQPAAPTAWSDAIRLDVIRFRFTPARGEFYGPPAAARTTPPAVQAGTHDFLRGNAGWLGSPRDARRAPLRVVTPDDTIDERQGSSLGVVDDTCDARIEVVLSLAGRPPLAAHATVFVAPPDFAPDRRPFLSVADELGDRAGDAVKRNAELKPVEREAWVEDLFERIFETAALFNVDRYRLEWGAMLPPALLTPPPGIPGDRLRDDRRAMGARDQLRNRELEPVKRADAERPLPLSERARERHRDLSDIDALTVFVRDHAGRLRRLIRGPFELEAVEDRSEAQTMRMPPFMRNSNYNPLTLSAWQYALLMEWVGEVEASATPAVGDAAPAARPLPTFAARRREATLARLGRRPRA
ncbi:MAG TPA: hypothetical protein VK548_25475 [Candidatus Acidoferrum sp.]|nr:hypothetical protein [Candidatus Acidoferrum sp.]